LMLIVESVELLNEADEAPVEGVVVKAAARHVRGWCPNLEPANGFLG
jgi:hypothetical protein